MEREELISLITKFHQKSITDLELAKLKMFVSQPEAQEILENTDFPASLEQGLVDVPADIYAGISQRISVPARPQKQKNRYLWIAAAASILLVTSFITWMRSKPSAQRVVWAEILTAPGERKKVALPDGSVVCLNAGSYLSYPEQYPDTVRQVYLKGEAFFEIAQEADQPFIVQTAHTTTRVLGTRFNIEAHEREGITRVALVEGKIETGDGTNRMILLPGKMMVHENSTGHQSVSAPEGDVAAWIKGELVFNGVSLKEALQRISEGHNIRITMTRDISNTYTITGHFQKEHPERILDALLAVYGLKWRKSPDGYEVYQ